jgi:outer membrane protein TolC
MIDAPRGSLGVALAALVALGAPARGARADAGVPSRFTLDEAIAFAVENHPGLRAAHARERAADARIDEARAGELPSAGVGAQLNRSTGNAVPGAFFAMTGVPNVAGAARGKTLDGGAFQTGVNVWASWDVSTFLQKGAAADVASADRREASASTAVRRLAVEVAVADAFLGVVAAREVERAARASVSRAEVLVNTVRPLVEQSLRPGADMARAQAELALAGAQLARAEQVEDVRRAELAEALGIAGREVEIVPGALAAPLGRVAAPVSPAGPAAPHPLVQQRDAAVQRAAEARRAVVLEYLPHVSLVASLWLRGGGIGPMPTPTADGLVPDTPNWAAGVLASWSALDIPEVRARTRVAGANEAAAVAYRDEAKLAVDGELAAAQARFRGALRVAESTAPAVAAAQAAERQATARYAAGLAPVIEVADAQRLLAQAELEDALARVEVRRALLYVARATGDVAPFLAAVRATGGG